MKDKDKGTVETAVTVAANGVAGTGNMKDACGQKGCFSYEDGHCQCLSDTDFGGRACPFFKTIKQYERDLAAHPLKSEYGAEEDDFLSANADLINELSDMDAEAARIEREGCEEGVDTDTGYDDWGDEEEGDEEGGSDG